MLDRIDGGRIATEFHLERRALAKTAIGFHAASKPKTGKKVEQVEEK
jgi:hypothetical protein